MRSSRFRPGCTSSTCQKILINEETTVSGATLPVRAELGVAVDGAGNVFVGDFLDGEVVEVPANGSTPTMVYNPTGANPVGLDVDAAGDLFIADHGLKQVAEVPAGCSNSSCWKTIGSGWQQPDSVAVDAAGDVYVADEGPTNSTCLGRGRRGTSTQLHRQLPDRVGQRAQYRGCDGGRNGRCLHFQPRRTTRLWS